VFGSDYGRDVVATMVFRPQISGLWFSATSAYGKCWHAGHAQLFDCQFNVVLEHLNVTY
jgi:hypothetical protein